MSGEWWHCERGNHPVPGSLQCAVQCSAVCTVLCSAVRWLKDKVLCLSALVSVCVGIGNVGENSGTKYLIPN